LSQAVVVGVERFGALVGRCTKPRLLIEGTKWTIFGKQNW